MNKTFRNVERMSSVACSTSSKARTVTNNRLWTRPTTGVILNILHTSDELSDYDNMVDEEQLEPDYYIDRPVRFH